MSNRLSTFFFGFFIILATTLNFGFFWGDINNPEHHHIYELFAAIIVNLIALTLKFGNKSNLDTLHIAASTVSCLQLLIASIMWFIFSTSESFLSILPSIVSLSGGALLANFISVTLLLIDSTYYKRF